MVGWLKYIHTGRVWTDPVQETTAWTVTAVHTVRTVESQLKLLASVCTVVLLVEAVILLPLASVCAVVLLASVCTVVLLVKTSLAGFLWS